MAHWLTVKSVLHGHTATKRTARIAFGERAQWTRTRAALTAVASASPSLPSLRAQKIFALAAHRRGSQNSRRTRRRRGIRVAAGSRATHAESASSSRSCKLQSERSLVAYRSERHARVRTAAQCAVGQDSFVGVDADDAHLATYGCEGPRSQHPTQRCATLRFSFSLFRAAFSLRSVAVCRLSFLL